MFLVFKNGSPPPLPLSATMTPKAITSALAAAQVLFLPNNGQPYDDDLVNRSDAILPIFLKATYDHVNGIHNLWGLVASADCYIHHYGAPFICPATRLACYDPIINADASRVDHICAETAWAALIQDYKAYEAAERGVNRGSIGKIIICFAPNIIFSVGSCICMLYDLTCQVLLKKSTHRQSYTCSPRSKSLSLNIE